MSEINKYFTKVGVDRKNFLAPIPQDLYHLLKSAFKTRQPEIFQQIREIAQHLQDQVDRFEQNLKKNYN